MERVSCSSRIIVGVLFGFRANVVPGPSRAEVLEEEEGVEEDVGVLEVLSSGGSVAEGLIGEELTGEELAGEPMEEVVKAPVAAVPLASVEQGERVPRTVEEWGEKMGGNAFVNRMCRRMGRLMGEGRSEEANVL
ncbi:predicted protein [Histoplasma mississippiense (nom. inval.)]|uniref:predicted protein n=1 Tax=Ajellomyces capsulatus (strain NAm1 / WU24) TaxID=2059318 RepID=UPI000157D358|nr:predicted protein [Histoplasma mississippiense (nom. inval.)]EDN04665.1 predicted protein [Histoplasma mississippiense (nom. inval.)]